MTYFETELALRAAYIRVLKQQNAELLKALKEMINPPTIMDHDHPFEIASWFVEKAKQAIAKVEGGE